MKGEEYVVAIAAGRNSGNDTGIVNEEKGLKEEELTIEVAERVEELLNKYSNIKVVQTGSTSRNPDGVEPEDRAERARKANPDLCIQIYFGDGDEVGVETIYKEGDQVSQQLANILAENISSSMGLSNLSAGEDTVKCVDAEGNASSLNIIENSVVAGFPSVVAIGGNLKHYRDRYNLECDNVVHFDDGRYALIETKLGGTRVKEAEEHLLELQKLIIENEPKLGKPEFLMVITGTEMAYTTEEGILVVPIGCLKD